MTCETKQLLHYVIRKVGVCWLCLEDKGHGSTSLFVEFAEENFKPLCVYRRTKPHSSIVLILVMACGSQGP